MPVERLRKEVRISVDGSVAVEFRTRKNERGHWRLASYGKRILVAGRPPFVCGMATADLYDLETESWPTRFRMLARRKGRTELSFVYSEPGRPTTRRFSIPILVR